MVEKVIQLKCSCNSYPWGQKGSESFAARLCAKTPGTNFKIDESKPYSEMWMGTYPELPSYVLKTGDDLQDVLDANSVELVGRSIPKKFGHTKLPYLPKVLSIAKALPLQLHPNKSLAADLHARDPSNFTDPNHKPEIALALSDFEAFVGFKPLKDIEALMTLPPLQAFMPLVRKPVFDDQTLKHIVKAILQASDEAISKTTTSLLEIPRKSFGKEGYIPDMIPRLAEQYDKTDPGIVVALVTMNYMTLKPGQCIYIPADSIHAYLSGTIIECMARSNNVLNTGFCPRGDRNSADLFCSSLTFIPHAVDEAILDVQKFDRSRNGKTELYAPPLSEFSVLATKLGDGEKETIQALGGPSIFICTKGEGTLEADGKSYEVKEGYVFFVGVDTEMEFVAKKEMQVFTAFAE